MDFIVIEGDIADQYADALVSPSSSSLTMSGGAARALLESAGEELRDAAQTQAPVEPGQVVVTEGFDLHADFVVHAVTLEGGRGASEKIVREATVNSLEAADGQGCRSVVFPALGAGIGKLSARESAAAMAAEIDGFDADTLADVRLIGYTPKSRWEMTEGADEVRYSGVR